MQIRLQGLPEVCAEALQRLASVVRVVEVSAPRPNTRHDPASKVVRVYGEVRLDEPPEPAAFTAARETITAQHCPVNEALWRRDEVGLKQIRS